MATVSPISNAAVVISPPSSANNEKLKFNKKVLTGLGIAEVVIGSLSIIISCILLGYIHSPERYGHTYYPYKYFNIGEGIWCGIWILVGGALGIASGRKRPTLCLINCHMAFSIIGSIFSAVMMSVGITAALLLSSYEFPVGLESLLAIGGFITLILCIVSAVYCCKTTASAGLGGCCGSCCAGCCAEQQVYVGGQAAYHVIGNQGPQHVQPGVVQSYPYAVAGQPTMYPSNLVTVVHPIAPGSNQQVAAGNQQPIFVAQQQTFVAQQPQTSSADAASDPEINNKQQEAINAAKNAAFNEHQRENPPSYFDDQ